MKVPYSYLSRQFADPEPIFDRIRSVVASGDFTLGKEVETFERAFAKLIGTKHAVGVGSGTDALFLSLKAFNIGAGDEVITTANTFVATVGAIETAGARTVFVDCGDDYVMDVNKVEAAITPRTKALMPVHYAGHPVDMKPLLDVARRHKLRVIEDACQAIGAETMGKRCGSLGNCGGFSLHPLKNLNVWGDGGVITTDDNELASKLRLMRNHGMRDRDHYAFYAYNSRLDAVHAAVGNHLIGDVEEITEKRIDVAARYDAAFRTLAPRVKVPIRRVDRRYVYHLYILLVDDRDRALSYLQERGIEAKVHYPLPLHLQEASAHLGYHTGDFPVAEAQAKAMLSLPIHQHLTDEEVEYTVDTMKAFFR